MASSSSSSSSLLFIFAYIMLPTAASLSFSFPSFNSSTEQFITFQNDTVLNSGNNRISLTKNGFNTPMTQSVGRAYYNKSIPLHNAATGKFADFTTHFSFVINAQSESNSGDGMAFFLSPFPSILPPHSAGGAIGLIESRTVFNESANQIVAVEFDTFKNNWDPSANHIGIDVNSIKSAVNVSWNSSIKDSRRTANAWISYNAATTNLSVFLTYDANPIFAGNSSLYHIVNLSKILPDEVAVGFSASTGDSVETHEIVSWDFNSTTLYLDHGKESKKNRAGLIVGVTVSVVLILVAASLVCFFFLRRRKNAGGFGGEEECVEDIDDGEFEKGRVL